MSQIGEERRKPLIYPSGCVLIGYKTILISQSTNFSLRENKMNVNGLRNNY